MSQEYESHFLEYILVQKFYISTNSAVDRWATDLKKYIASVPVEQPFYSMTDITGDDIEFTPYARDKLGEICVQYKGHPGYMAFVLSWRTAPYVARIFLASFGKLGFSTEYFTSYDKALAWLKRN